MRQASQRTGEAAAFVTLSPRDLCAAPTLSARVVAAPQALVEVKVLTHIREHDPHNDKNTVRTLNHFYFRSHLCIVFELLSINLYEFIKNNNFKGVSLQLIKRFAVQLLNMLRFLRKMRILHCDLKPENILLCECVTPVTRT